MVWTYPEGIRTAEWDETIKARKFLGDGSNLTGIPVQNNVVYPLAQASGGTGTTTALQVAFPLIIASGGTSTTLATGTGQVVLRTTPTIDTPTLTNPIISTSLTAPILIGGSTYDGVLTIRSTSGNGNQDFITFQLGNNGAKEGMRITNQGEVVAISILSMTSIGDGTFAPKAALTLTGTSGGIHMSNWNTAALPTALTGEGSIYVSGGRLYYLGGSGSVTQLAAA